MLHVKSFLVFTLLLLYSCNTSINVNRIADNSFSKTELHELSIITALFDTLLTKGIIENNGSTYMEKYMNHIESSISGTEVIQRHFNCFDTNDLLSCFKVVKSLDLYHKIWSISQPYDHRANKIYPYELAYNTQGAYLFYLKKLYRKDSEKYPFFVHIYNRGGDITPFMVANFQKQALKYYDVDNNYKIIVPIHYFTLIFNEMSKRNMIKL